MTTQIVVRLPSDLVAFLDSMVAQGAASSRGSIVVMALRREMRRQLAERDARVLAAAGEGDELLALPDHSILDLD